MDKISLVELQKIDCNCNDCIFMQRNLEELKKWNYLYSGQERASHRILYGHCINFNKPVTFIANTCQLDTQDCFKHRRENNLKQ